MADSSFLPFPKMNMTSWERDAAGAAGIGVNVNDDDNDNEDNETPSQRLPFARYANEATSRPYIHLPPYSAPPHLGDGYNQFYPVYGPDDQVERIASQASMSPNFSSFAAHPGQQEANSSDDDRKPAARLLLEKKKVTHVKRHSISSDPYHEHERAKQLSGFASSPAVHEGTRYDVDFGRSIPLIRSPQDHFINPTMSFGDDDDDAGRGWSDVNILAQTSEQYIASPPPVASYPPPPPISFSFRDTHTQQSTPLLPPPSFAEEQPVPSIRPSRKSRMANRRLLSKPLSSVERIGGAIALKDLRPSAEELASATTPRAQAALQVWYSRLSQLYQYKLEHNGDTNVPQKYKPNPSLGIWVNKQRMEKKFLDEGKKSSMTQRRIQLLEAIDFQWGKAKGDAAWMQKYNELREYLQEKGDCNVPTKYAPNPALGRWVSTQRSEYKKFLDNNSKLMTMERINKLNKIGFCWEILPANRSRSDSE